MNGQGAFALQIPAGGAKLPISPETSELKEDSNGNFRSQNHLVMKGDEVFNFVQTIVPSMIESILETSNVLKEDIDYYIFHQPNKFMLRKLANRLNIDESKMPNNVVENFGNASGVSIPTAITFNLKELTNQTHKICLAGFGVGLTWASMVMELGKLNFCEMIDY
jgi:3-oxoacyl-[acyl-carrier-protein] synthase-3